MADLTAKDAKLVQYLNEAYNKEKELETTLQAHAGMTTRAPYKKRLQQHLRETKAQAKAVERRIKQLGGKADVMPGPEAVAGAATTVQTAAGRAMALAKGPFHALRGTGEQEKMLKNAKTEYFNEHEEIATYTAIEALADSVGDRDTVKLARDIRREEERMAKFLERQIPQLTKAVAQEEIPASERRRGTTRRRTSTRRAAASGRSRASASGTRRSGGSRRSGASTRRSAAGRASRGRSSRGGGRS